MNSFQQDGITIIQTPDAVTIDGKHYQLPDEVRGDGRRNEVEVADGEIWVNGYRLNPENGTWEKPNHTAAMAVLVFAFLLLLYFIC